MVIHIADDRSASGPTTIHNSIGSTFPLRFSHFFVPLRNRSLPTQRFVHVLVIRDDLHAFRGASTAKQYWGHILPKWKLRTTIIEQRVIPSFRLSSAGPGGDAASPSREHADRPEM